MAGDPLADPVGAHHLWTAVAAGVPAAGRRPPTSRTRSSSATTRRTSSSTATAGSTRWRRSPPSFPAAGTASSGTGTSPTRTARGCGRSPRSPRSCSTASRSRTRCCGRAASASGWPRSAIPTSTSTYGTHVFEIRYSIAGRPRPRNHRRRQDFRRDRRAQPSDSPSVFFWNVVAQSWNNRIERADISVTLPGDVGRVAVLRRLRGGPGMPRSDRRRGHRRRFRRPTFRRAPR